MLGKKTAKKDIVLDPRDLAIDEEAVLKYLSMLSNLSRFNTLDQEVAMKRLAGWVQNVTYPPVVAAREQRPYFFVTKKRTLLKKLPVLVFTEKPPLFRAYGLTKPSGKKREYAKVIAQLDRVEPESLKRYLSRGVRTGVLWFVLASIAAAGSRTAANKIIQKLSEKERNQLAREIGEADIKVAFGQITPQEADRILKQNVNAITASVNRMVARQGRVNAIHYAVPPFLPIPVAAGIAWGWRKRKTVPSYAKKFGGKQPFVRRVFPHKHARKK